MCPDHMGTLQLDGERIRQKQVVLPDLFHIFVFIEGHLCRLVYLIGEGRSKERMASLS